MRRDQSRSVIELKNSQYDSRDITMNLERNLCNNIMQNAFSFTKKVELVVAKILGNAELRNKYSEINRLPFYAFVS